MKATRQQYSLLRPTQDKMELASLKLAEIDKRKTLLLKLTNERKSCYAILAGLGTIVPPEIKLTGMETLGKDVILIKGIAEKYPDLAKFMQLMEQNESNIFIQPILIKAETDTTTSSISSIATKFELNIKLKGL
ncbi:Fimbrial assembly protein [Methylomusa anaerophila]|uniref:Fimbrial assembly protein n=2 Tax=Methylomusa anaerophila TaxID=1930071 RepID=A0A348AQG6_9FIRM|nr:Fimbrial assembly protein [Methylomusa anaerophila]